MTHVLLYWNHICVLHNQEKKFLKSLTERLKVQEIDLEIRYFGLGYPEHMSEYLIKEDAVLPDMIVSADLEVFEDRRIFDKFRDQLYPAADWVKLRQGRALDAVKRDERLLPFLAIPLVCYTGQPTSCKGKNIHEIDGLVFGGINNSAGKTLVKAIWSRYGKTAAEHMVLQHQAEDMPIGAFQKARLKEENTAVVPSLYAMRADGKDRFMCIPKEGPLLIPSFLCAGRTIPEEVARTVTEAIFCPELCGFYENSGNLLVYPACAAGNQWEMDGTYFTPDRTWYDAVTPEEFYEVYERLQCACQ